MRKADLLGRELIDKIPILAWSCRPDGTAEFLNQQWINYTGFSSNQAVDGDWLAAIHPEDIKKLVDSWLLTTGELAQEEARLRRFDGEYRWFLFRAVPLQDQRGQVVKWYGTSTDIEDRKQTEEIRIAQSCQAGVRADVSVAFAKPAHLREILRGCAEAIVRHLDAAFARIWSSNKDGNMLELQASAGMYTRLDGSYSRIPIGDLKVGWIAREKKPHLTNDVLSDPRIHDKRWAQAGGFVSFAGYPLIVEERVVGVMALFARHPLSKVTLDTLASVADTIAQGIERKRVEEKLRLDERELRRITDAIPHLIAVLGPDGRILYANHLVLDYSGLSLETIMADDFRARVCHPDDLVKLGAPLQAALVAGAPYELELRARRKDGQYRWFLVRFNPFRDESANIIRWYATGTDVEDRKQTEERVHKEILALREEIDYSSMSEEIVGSSEALRNVLQQVARVAPVDSTVLILGETGTGKELIASAIHKRSNRSSRAFIRVNCAAIPPALIASELFGHEKGAFTGAHHQRLGRFELANGGTIFLDEVSELPAEIQIALLRVLQEREFERLGSTRPISVNVRVLAATNRDLKAAIEAGKFRRDLLYRLNVFPIEIPPLRARQEDIPLLVEYFIHRYARKLGKKIRSADEETLHLFRSYPWPGNIRELQNVIERAIILCDKEFLSVDSSWLFQEEEPSIRSEYVPLAKPSATRERAVIEAALKEAGGRISGPSGAAAKLNLPPSTLESKIRALKIDKYRFKSL